MHQIKPRLPAFLLGCALFLVIFVALTSPSWTILWALWTGDGSGYSHGPLVIGICLWLWYERWGLLQSSLTAPKYQTIIALVLGGIASVTWTIGFATNTGMLQWLSLPLIAASALIASSRGRAQPSLLAPFIAAFFALPVWELLVPGLQSLAVKAVSTTVDLVGIPAYIEGIEVTIPGGRFIVEGGCSGVRYLLVSLALTSLWGFLHAKKTSHAVLLILFGGLLSMISNWVRIFLIVIIGYKTHMQSPLVYDHELFGWLLFAATLVPIMIAAVWIEKQSSRQSKNPSVDTAPQWNYRAGAMAICLLAIPILAGRLFIDHIPPLDAPQLAKKFETDNGATFYQQTNDGKALFGGWRPAFSSIDTWQAQRYEPGALEVLVGHIPLQSNDKELFSVTNSFDMPSTSTQFAITTDNDRLTIRNLYNQQWVAKVFYRVGGEITNGGLQGKKAHLQALFNKRNDAQLIVIGFPCDSSCEEQRLDQVTGANVQSLLSK